MTLYSGRTTAYEHKHGDAWKQSLHAGPDCIQQQTIFDVQWSNCPVEVEEEVKRLWLDMELHNNVCYYSWSGWIKNDEYDGPSEDAEAYPIIAEYLKTRGVTECLIHWWW